MTTAPAGTQEAPPAAPPVRALDTTLRGLAVCAALMRERILDRCGTTVGGKVRPGPEELAAAAPWTVRDEYRALEPAGWAGPEEPPAAELPRREPGAAPDEDAPASGPEVPESGPDAPDAADEPEEPREAPEPALDAAGTLEPLPVPERAWDAFGAAHDAETFTGQQEAVQEPGGAS